MKKVVTFLKYEQIDFGLDRLVRPNNLIYHFTRQRRGPQMQIEHTDHLGFAACFIRNGSLHFEQNNHSIDLSYGSVILRRPHLPYTFVSTGPEEIDFLMINFDPHIEPIWNRLIPPDCFHVHLSNPERIFPLVELTFELLIRNEPARIERANAFAPFLLETVMANDTRNQPLLQPGDDIAERCLHYLHDHYRTIRDLQEVVEHCHTSRSNLYKLFKERGEVSPRDYLNRLKCRTASDLLLNTNWTTERIAHEIGYADAAGFSKAFKRITGKTPRTLRKQGLPRHQLN